MAFCLILGILAGLLLLSGLDDLVPVAICIWHALRSRKQPVDAFEETHRGRRRIAIFVPCWKEAGVIGNMVRHNLAAIRYQHFDFFIGVYPNDAATAEVAGELASSFRNVHAAVCPHPGPTSKADCLNSIYQRMLAFERDHQVRFDIVVLHDAEDLIHPDALSVIDRERSRYDMVQIPVLPLSAGLGDLTHGIYCDEFAEYQTIDMPARQFSRSFIPSNGVGTGFAREIFEQLEKERGSRIFDPASLTEDYEIGVYAHRRGFRQLFLPLKRGELGFTATREYFPRTMRSAIRQRTRWVTGIALQGWERDGWRGGWRIRYWFWRDRKGLIANPLSLLANLIFLAGLADWLHAQIMHRPWAFAVANPIVVTLCWITLFLPSVRLILRCVCVGRVFGAVFALGVPLRVFQANLVNSIASVAALWTFVKARALRRPLAWVKTEHSYPTLEMLLANGFVSNTDFRPMRIDMSQVRIRVTRSLPVHIQERFGIVPFKVQAGRLLVAGTRAPSADVLQELKNFTRLPVEFQLVSQTTYEELRTLL